MSEEARLHVESIHRSVDWLRRRELDNALALTVLRNIAGGHWNAGREQDITAVEYAQWAVDVVDGKFFEVTA